VSRNKATGIRLLTLGKLDGRNLEVVDIKVRFCRQAAVGDGCDAGVNIAPGEAAGVGYVAPESLGTLRDLNRSVRGRRVAEKTRRKKKCVFDR
jgi:hypothetical protein